MKGTFKKAFAAIMACMLACQLVLPASLALAEERSVAVDNHTYSLSQKTTVSDIRIGDVDKPVTGKALDDTAKVSTAEEKTWDVPVLWVRDDLSIVKTAEEGRTYLPVVAFVVPDDYAIQGSSFQVVLSDELTALFGTEETVSVYNEQTGITYILPASLRFLFAQAAVLGQTYSEDTPGESAEESPSLVDLYCAQTARAAFSDEDLAWLIDLIINKLQPQAVNLLIEKFPAFADAAKTGGIGTRIGLYIYFEKGDADGDPFHEGAPRNALAYVSGDAVQFDGATRYAYMVGLDASSLIVKDAAGNPVRDAATGKYVIVRSGEDFETLQNTIVHEMFHAFMDDYTRLGMFGTGNLDGREADAQGNFANSATQREYLASRFPNWFIEGSASAVENVYQFRSTYFSLLGKEAGGTTFIADILSNYCNASLNGSSVYFDLEVSEDERNNNPDSGIDTTPSRYVAGYLAVLYLSDLTYRYTNNGASAISGAGDDQYVASADKLRSGLNQVLVWLHNGTTFDDIVSRVSPVDATTHSKVYKSADDFTKLFIKGAPATGATSGTPATYSGDTDSLTFVAQFLKSMTGVQNRTGSVPNGSILFDFDTVYTTPLDASADASSDYYRIIDSNTAVESSVASDTGAIGAGKSSLTVQAVAVQAVSLAAADAGALAAKADGAEEDATEADADSAAAQGEAVDGSEAGADQTGSAGDPEDEGAPDGSDSAGAPADVAAYCPSASRNRALRKAA